MDAFLAIAAKIGSQRHLVAVRDSFAATMPILMAGSLAVLINAIPGIINDIIKLVKFKNTPVPEDFVGFKWPDFIPTMNGNIWWGSFAMMTIFIVILVAYNLAKSYEADPLSASLIAIATYIAIIPQSGADYGWGLLHVQYLNATALLVGMLISIITTEIFVRFAKNKKLILKMPDGVPPAVARSFAALIPGVITMFIVVAVFLTLYLITGSDEATRLNIWQVITKFVMAPLQTVSNTVWAAIVVVLFASTLWIFGLHGSNIIDGVVQSVYIPALEANANAFQAGQPCPFIVTKPFIDCFVFLGGSGATLGLLIAIFALAKSKTFKYMSRLSLGPGCFNINEPVIFGLPIVLNPVFAIPFIITPVVLAVVSYYATKIGFVRETVVMSHWAMPPILSGFIATAGDIKASLLQIINIGISFAIYMPFVVAADKAQLKLEMESESEEAAN